MRWPIWWRPPSWSRWSGPSSYDPAKGDPAAWLLGIAANLLANQRRRAVREQLARARLDARALLTPDDVETLLARMDASVEAARLRAAMETLPEPYRQVLLLAGESSLSPAAAAKAWESAPPRSGCGCPGPAGPCAEQCSPSPPVPPWEKATQP